MFWKKKKAEPPLQFPEPRELTGIEKHAKEEEAKRIAACQKQSAEQREHIMARISELREQIKPQTDEIQTLEMQLNPFQYANYAMQRQLNGSYAGYPTVGSSLSGLLGFGGALHQ